MNSKKPCRLCAAHEARNPDSKVDYCSNPKCGYYDKATFISLKRKVK